MSTEEIAPESVEITIDGTTVTVPKGTKVLDVATDIGIDIPTLCNHPELKPNGSCRMCIVQVSRPGKDPKKTYVVSACVYPASDGLKVRTDAPEVLAERKQTVEKYLDRAPKSETIRALAAQIGVTGATDETANGAPHCIACGVCVRVCGQLIGANALTLDKKAKNEADPFPAMDDLSLCIGCQACAYVCPTGVIEWIQEDKKLVNKRWGVSHDIVYCEDCGELVGTTANLARVKENTAAAGERINRCPACRRKITVKAALH